MYLTKFNQSECFKTSSHVNTNQVDSLFTKIADSPPISPEGSESPLQFQQSIMDLFEFPSKWMKCIMLPEGYSIIYNKYSSACIMHLSCMTDELQLRKWMGNSLRQMSPFSTVLTDKLQLDLNKVSNFMLSNWYLIQFRQPPTCCIMMLTHNLICWVLASSPGNGQQFLLSGLIIEIQLC